MSMYTIKNLEHYDSPKIIRNDGAVIPADPLNADYLEYVQWLFDGNTAEEWNPDTTTESVES